MPPTLTYSVAPFAVVPVDGDAADLLSGVLSALEQQPNAIGPAAGYNYEKGTISAVFQVELPAGSTPELASASKAAVAIFTEALQRAGIVDAHTAGLSIVLGDDPDLLP